MMPSHDPECQNASRYHVHPVNRSVQSVDMAEQSSHKIACMGGYVSHGREAQGLLPRITRQSETFFRPFPGPVSYILP